MKPMFLRLAFAFAAALAFMAGARAEPAKMPTLTVKTLDGGTFDLAAERGKWVIVNFWATWCSPCIKEMPDISKFVASRSDVSAIGLAFGGEEIGDVTSFLEKHPRDARAEDAAYLRVIALQRSGDSAGTKQAALEYLRRYPAGFRHAEVEPVSR